jgi:chorismate mutase/prephenate dehydratase
MTKTEDIKKIKNKEIIRLRKHINKIDDEIIALLNERASIAKDIGNIKRKSTKPLFYCPEREKAVLNRLCSNDSLIIPKQGIRKIFSEIMHHCLTVQQTNRPK